MAIIKASAEAIAANSSSETEKLASVKKQKPKNTIIGVGNGLTEKIMHIVFLICSSVAIIALLLITIYMISSGAPIISKVGLKDFIFGDKWAPTKEIFGISPMILTSVFGTIAAILIGVPIGLMTSVFLAEIAPKSVVKVVQPAVELLAGIPSVIYGLLGAMIIKPLSYKIEMLVFKDNPEHIYTGGANMFSAVIVLAIMILPTIINISRTAIIAVPEEYREASYGLGATHIQTIFKVILPAAKSGIATAVVLGVGRAIGEAMAIILVAGNMANMPEAFNSVKFLTTGVVQEFAYSSGVHREALFGIGLVLFVFIMIINIVLNLILKGKAKAK